MGLGPVDGEAEVRSRRRPKQASLAGPGALGEARLDAGRARESWAGPARGPRARACMSGRGVELLIPEQGRGRVAAADGAVGEQARMGRRGAVPAEMGRSGHGDHGSSHGSTYGEQRRAPDKPWQRGREM